jgi:hypothetical protein
MKKHVIIFALVLAALPLSAQMRNAVNASLESWTVNDAESELKAKVSNVIIQQNGNIMQYTLQVRDEEMIRYQFNRVEKRLRRDRKGEDMYTTAEASFAESGSTSSLTYTDKNGAVNVLHFKKK